MVQLLVHIRTIAAPPRHHKEFFLPKPIIQELQCKHSAARPPSLSPLTNARAPTSQPPNRAHEPITATHRDTRAQDGAGAWRGPADWHASPDSSYRSGDVTFSNPRIPQGWQTQRKFYCDAVGNAAAAANGAANTGAAAAARKRSAISTAAAAAEDDGPAGDDGAPPPPFDCSGNTCAIKII